MNEIAPHETAAPPLDALRRSEERYRALVEATTGTVWSWAPDLSSGEFTQVQQWWLNVTGQSVADQTRTPIGWIDVVHPDDREVARHAWETSLGTGAPYDMQYRVRARTGGWRHLHARGVPIYGPSGAVREWVGTLTDVTDRIRTEAERAHASEALALALGAAELGTWEWDPETDRMTLSDRAAELFGVPAGGTRAREEIVALIHPDHRERAKAAGAAGGRSDYDAEYLLDRGVWLAARGRGLYDTAGNLTRMIGVVQDATVRKRAEVALRASEERFRALVEGVHDYAIVTLEPGGRVVSWNAGAERINGYTADEIVGWPFAIFYTPEAAAAGDPGRELATATAAGRFEQEGWRVRRDGSRFWANTVITALMDPARHLVGFSHITRDLTAHREAEERLRQSTKMEAVGKLAGGVAHDFNNLLTVINGYSAQILKTMSPNDPAAEPVAEIHAAGKRAADLTRQLLAFGRQQVLRPKVLNLNELISNLTKMLGRLLGEDVRLATILSPSLGRVTADAGQIEQVLVNLCVNARDAMPQGGQLTIETDTVAPDLVNRGACATAPGPYARITVTDTGTGMTDEVREKIFEPFFTTKGVGEGSGLGLSTVLGIVEQSGGHIEVRSAVGAGAAFAVYLPITGAAPETVSDVVRSAPRGRETVLLVEDERAVRVFTAMVLRGAGYTVLEAPGAAEAVRAHAAAGGRVSLLLTDVVMPHESGRELAERLRAEAPELRVLYMSGYTDDRVLRHGVQSSDVAFIQKPFEPEVLLHKVREVLDPTAADRGAEPGQTVRPAVRGEPAPALPTSYAARS